MSECARCREGRQTHMIDDRVEGLRELSRKESEIMGSREANIDYACEECGTRWSRSVESGRGGHNDTIWRSEPAPK